MNDGDWGLWSRSGPRTELQIDFALSEAEILWAGDIKAQQHYVANVINTLWEYAALHN